MYWRDGSGIRGTMMANKEDDIKGTGSPLQEEIVAAIRSEARSALLSVLKDPSVISVFPSDSYPTDPYSKERRSFLDRREELREWSQGVFDSLKATKEDLTEVKKDVKSLTNDVSEVKKELAVMGKDREKRWEVLAERWKTMEERWDEIGDVLVEIKENGCDVYTMHRQTYSENARAEERQRIEREQAGHIHESAPVHEDLVGRTWPDVLASFTPVNIAFIVVILSLLFYVFGGVDKLFAWLGLG